MTILGAKLAYLVRKTFNRADLLACRGILEGKMGYLGIGTIVRWLALQ